MDRFEAFVVGTCIVAVALLAALHFAGSRFNVVQENQAKVVKIGVVVDDKKQFTGSGAIITRDGLILTCAHLARHTGKLFVKTASGQTYLARIVRIGPSVDLAVLKIDAKEDLPYFEFGANPYIGQEVGAYGSPLAIQGVVTFGRVEKVNAFKEKYTIQGCPTNPGNSGGPLVDKYGRLVGVNVAVMQLDVFQLAQGLGLSIGMDDIREFVRI